MGNKNDLSGVAEILLQAYHGDAVVGHAEPSQWVAKILADQLRSETGLTTAGHAILLQALQRYPTETSSAYARRMRAFFKQTRGRPPAPEGRRVDLATAVFDLVEGTTQPPRPGIPLDQALEEVADSHHASRSSVQRAYTRYRQALRAAPPE